MFISRLHKTYTVDVVCWDVPARVSCIKIYYYYCFVVCEEFVNFVDVSVVIVYIYLFDVLIVLFLCGWFVNVY